MTWINGVSASAVCTVCRHKTTHRPHIYPQQSECSLRYMTGSTAREMRHCVCECVCCAHVCEGEKDLRALGTVCHISSITRPLYWAWHGSDPYCHLQICPPPAHTHTVIHYCKVQPHHCPCVICRYILVQWRRTEAERRCCLHKNRKIGI